MFKYFDKTFFKFLLGFLFIIFLSLTIIVVAKAYQDDSLSGKNTASVINSIKNK